MSSHQLLIHWSTNSVMTKKVSREYMVYEMRLKDERMAGREEELEQGRVEGREEGLEQGKIASAANLMKSMSLTKEQALKAIGIKGEYLSKYLALL